VSSIPHPDFLIIDEGLSVLDQDNMPKCLQLLQGLKSYFKTILIVSHIPAVQEIVDSVLEITNNGFESKINFE
jgi:DNA repair exonuclease SbcCD ATPase subunit